MKILYIWDADYPWDIRVEKICLSLVRNGHEMHIVARNLKKLPEYELVDGIHVHRMKVRDNETINYILSFPAFFSPFWISLITKIIKYFEIDLIIVRDLPLAAAGIYAGKKYKLPVIFDMAEDYCAMIREIWKQRKYYGFNFFVRNPYLAKLVEKFVIKKFDHIFVVVEEAKNLVINEGVEKDKVTVIGNSPILDDLQKECSLNNKIINFIKSKYAAIYTGGITPDRGLSVVVDAIPIITKYVHDFLFVIIGKGYDTKNIINLINKNKIQDFVLLVGWIEHDLLYEYIKASKLGLVPHHVTGHTNTTIPNKIFDYMGCGIPVIASDADPMKRIIESEKCGKIFQSGNPIDLAKSIVSVLNSENDFGTNGKRAIQHKYNWNIEETKLVNTINSFSKG